LGFQSSTGAGDASRASSPSSTAGSGSGFGSASASSAPESVFAAGSGAGLGFAAADASASRFAHASRVEARHFSSSTRSRRRNGSDRRRGVPSARRIASHSFLVNARPGAFKPRCVRNGVYPVARNQGLSMDP
jgi:hypothetical protein